MAYTGKKPVDFVDVTQSQSMTVTDDLTVGGAFTSTGIDDNATSNAVTVDSSGNLLVGKSSSDIGTVGIELQGSNDRIFVTRSGDSTMYLNRTTSDGSILEVLKDGTTVGSIGAISGRIYIGSSSVQETYIGFNNNYVYPANSSGNFKDNAIDLGNASARYDDLYATNQTIQPSDQTMKQQIASLTDAEINAAKAISKLFKTFKWNESVEAKGDAARKHTGVIAQDVQQAMADAGLDAGDYAFFISNTWWETQTEVPAVAEAADEEGNVIVEAKEAYTRTDIYDTPEEAPEGATERTRLGIRYPELLAFIGAATEQRLASIEARLDALENA